MSFTTATNYDPEQAAQLKEHIENIIAAFRKIGEAIKEVFGAITELFEEIQQKSKTKKKYPQEREKKPPRRKIFQYLELWRKHKPP